MKLRQQVTNPVSDKLVATLILGSIGFLATLMIGTTRFASVSLVQNAE